MRIFTIGYEKRGIDDFIVILKSNSISVLADIRAIPHSRLKDYTKSNLESTLARHGIKYILAKELGSPKELRDKVKTDGDYDFFFDEYDKLLDVHNEHLRNLSKIVKSETTCLFCYEADVNRCHRR